MAESLLLSLNSKTDSGGPVFLDIPEINQAAVALAEKYKMKILCNIRNFFIIFKRKKPQKSSIIITLSQCYRTLLVQSLMDSQAG